MQRQNHIITATLVPEAQRLDTADQHFGIRYPLVVEPMVYQFAEQLAESYTGGYWHFYRLSNGGFYMAPNLDETFKIVADNGYEGNMTADAFGITACLYAFSNLSFNEGAFGENCARHYHWLLNFSLLQPEAKEIRAVID
ncbi:MAG: antirestriction protein [Rhodocyclaceae bacterium]|jgi:hypothetical protein|nr:antirestriction protein [Rhodocyclaceae bacterium]